MANYTFGEIDRNECVGNSLSTINVNFARLAQNLTDLESRLLAVSADSLGSVKEVIAGNNNVIVSEAPGTGIVSISSIGMPSGGISLVANPVISAVNVGGSGAGVFKQKDDRTLQFRKIVSGGSNVVIQQDDNSVKITAFDRRNAADLGEINTSSNAGSGVGLVMPKVGVNMPFKTLIPGTNVTLTESPSSVRIDSSIAVGAQSVGTGASVLASSTNNNIALKSISSASGNVNIQSTNNEVRISVTENLSGASVGGGVSIYKEKDIINNRLLFKSLSAGTNLVQQWPQTNNSPCKVEFLGTNAERVELTVSDNVSGINTSFSGTNGGRVFRQKTGNLLQFRSIVGQGQVQVSQSPGTDENVVISLLPNTTVLSAVAEGSNIGTGARVYKQKSGPFFVFRTLSGGSGITVSEQDSTITLNADLQAVTGAGVLTATNLGTGVGLVDSVAGAVLRIKSINSLVPQITITDNPATKTINLSANGFITGAQNNPNIFTGSQSIYENQVGNFLQFKKLLPGTGISLYEQTGHIVINATGAQTGGSSPFEGIDAFKNKFINGNLDVWQWEKRAFIDGTTNIVEVNDTSVTDTNNSTTLKFLADRFGFYAGRASSGATNPEATMTKFVMPLSSTAVNRPLSASRPDYGLRITLGTRAVNTAVPTRLIQRVENVKALAGKQLTVSFWARSNNTGSDTIAVTQAQCYKASESPVESGFFAPPISIGSVNITNNWQRYSVTFSLPQISQTLWNQLWLAGDQNSSWDSFTQIGFDVLGSNGRFVEFASLQLEEGNIATSFETHPLSIELAMCQRYYEIGNRLQTQFADSTTNGNTTYTSFKTTKRKAPVMQTGKGVLLRNAISSVPNVRITDHTYGSTYVDGFISQFTGSGSSVNSKPFIYNWAASAEF